MSTRATVLYDTPGPRGRRTNLILTVATIIVTALILWWVGSTLAANGQFEADKWTPVLKSTTWTTYLLQGLVGTLTAAALSIVLALAIGAALGLGRLSDKAWLRWICAILVEFFRAVPVLILIIFAYQLFAQYAVFPSAMLSFAAVVFGLTLYNGSVIAEILRSGIMSLPKGQTEAALALGLTRRQTTITIALKDSALGYTIGYVEVVRSGIQSASYYRNFFAALLVVAAIMFLINFALTRVAQRIEYQLRAGRARRNIVAAVPHQPDQGLETKDEVMVDWHDPEYKEIRNPGQ